ncbi:ATP-binding cassette domain-containing protein [Rhodococcoides kyotonense]|uniref:ABC-type transport system involved in cytochrome bd biosynthesis, ATPase and permease components n=1 Tax=Rhodococcoides kyotonense TaxID=398843 RepID=A0A239H2K0_9NOCA|nr:ATP-binding cassette domain-containing protein [Rhodococcus kyotonensis]SNS75365.1 ABC-type transport system involved in cytochrome bd biosynthesis, ATPase and permease components [Rhodococcus kyotonensis]
MIDTRLLAAARAEPGGVTATATTIAATATYVPQAWFLAHALAAIAGRDWNAAALWALAVVAVAGLRWVVGLAAATASSRHGLAVRRTLRDRAYAAALAPRGRTLRTGAARGAIVDGADGVEVYVSKYIGAVAQVAVLCPLTVVLLAFVSPLAAAAAAGGLVLAIFGPMWWRRRAIRRAADHWDDYETLSADFAEYYRSMTTVRALGAVDQTRIHIETRSAALHRATVATMRVSLADTAITDVAIQGATVAAAAVAAAHAVSGDPAPSVYLALLLAGECFRPIRELARHWHAGYLGLSAVSGLDAIGAFDTAGTENQVQSIERPLPGGRLELLDVTFAYDHNSVLRGVEVTVEPGGIVTVTGESGAGKSTLFDLISGVLRPTSGSISLGGNPVGPGDVAVVGQRPVFTSGSIRDNLLAVAPRSDADLVGACRAAGFGSVIDNLPHGLDEEIGEAGTGLSGGQRQRLAVARAILSDRPIVLVDEPTSALDEQTADEVLAALADLAHQRIVLVITHDPRVVEVADAQLVVAHGHVLPARVGAP